jgi:hypothetical protein
MPFYGNQHTDTNKKWSHQRLVTAVEALAADLGRSPTTQEAADDERFPCLATIYKYADDGWLSVLDDANLERTQVRGYGVRERPRMCRDLYGAFRFVDTPSLTHRQYDTLGAYPTSVVKEHFGSWRDACEAAGISPGQKHGEACEGPQGEQLESRLEQDVAEALYDCDIEYVPHPDIEGTAWIADFYLPGYSLWVEVDGYESGSRPNEHGFAQKIEHLRGTAEDVLVVESADDVVDALQGRGVAISS